MKNLFNLEDSPNLKKVVELIKDQFSTSLQTVINQDVTLEIAEFFTGMIDDAAEGFEKPAFVVCEESEKDLISGFIMNISDLTVLVDYMMMGEGESKDELDEETVDAAKELMNQVVSSLNVPLGEELGEKFGFAVKDVTAEKPDFDGEISGITFGIKAGNVDSKFVFFIDSKFNSYIDMEQDEDKSDLPDDFGAFSSPQQSGCEGAGGNIELLLDVEIPVSVKIGSTKMYLKDILELGPGKIIELEEYADEPVELLVNNKVIARGEVVVVDGYFGLRIQEIVSKAERIKKLKD